jgi:hypothetical protein
MTSSLKLSFQLSSPTTCTPFQPLTGTVLLDALQSVEVKTIKVYLFWQTKGEGEQEFGFLEPVFFEGGSLKAGEQLSYPFSLPHSAKGPFSYDGELLSVCWNLAGVVKLQRGLDVVVEEPFELIPEDDNPDFDTTTLNHQRRVYDNSHPGRLFGLRLALGLLFVGFACTGIGLVLQDRLNAFLVIGLTSLWLGGFVGVEEFGRRLVEGFFGPLRVEPADFLLSPGESLAVNAHWLPRWGSEDWSCKACLQAEEVVENKVNRHTIIKRQVVLEIPMEESNSVSDEEGKRHWDFFGQVPDDAPSSFAVSKNALNWSVAVCLSRRGRVWQKVEIPLTVVPSGATTLVREHWESLANSD